MNKRVIDDFIKIAEQREADAHGSNKKCFFIDNYALLSQSFTTDEIERIMQISEELGQKGVNVVKTLDYKVIEQIGETKNGNLVKGYVLQQKAIGNALVDENNWKKDKGNYQIDYLKQIDSISQEGQEFFNNFVRGWIEAQKAGLMIDPSKPSNFIYNPGQDLTFIDLNLSNHKTDKQFLAREQLAVILNSKTFNNCYPEIRQAVRKRLDIIMEKYKNALKEQEIVIDDNSLNMELSSMLKKDSIQTEFINETPEQEMERLEQSVAEHIKQEEQAREEARRLKEEKEKKERIESEKREKERKRLEEEEERQNGGKRNDSKMYAILYGLIEQGIIPENQAEIFKQIFQTKRNIYADLNPQLFKKQGTTIDIESVIPSIDSSNIKIDMKSMNLKDNGNISNETYEQIKTAVEDYFKQYFEGISKKAETKMIEYSKMREMHENKQLTEEQYIDYKLLEAELKEFSNSRQLFPFLNLDEQVLEKSNKVSNFLQEKNKMYDKKIIIENLNKDGEQLYLYRNLESKEIVKGTYRNSAIYDICTKEGEKVGYITVVISSSPKADKAEIEYMSKETSRNKGNITIALEEVLKDIFVDKSFNDLQIKTQFPKTHIEKVFLAISDDNYASQAVARKSGFSKKGSIYEMTEKEFYDKFPELIKNKSTTELGKETKEELLKNGEEINSMKKFFSDKIQEQNKTKEE